MSLRLTAFTLRIVLVWSLVTGHGTFASAQTVSQLVKAGDKEIIKGDFYLASVYYKDALQKDEENIDLLFKYAEACRMFGDLGGAEESFRKVIKLDKANQYPLAIFWLGEVLRNTCACKCEEIQKLFHKFHVKYRKKDYYYAKAQQEIESCAWVRDHSKSDDSVKIEHLGDEVNTPQSEFNAIHVFPDKIQFSALRNISSDKKNEKYLARIYNQPPNPETIYIPDGSNPELYICNGNYSPDSKKFFFTQCDQVNKTATRCDIYVSKYEDFKWTPAQKLSDHVNAPEVSNTHPSVGYDSEGNEVLFFSSDREGGEGNFDIWFSKLNTDGTYQQAVNAGNKINTKGNELTPFYDSNTKKLFFYSDWHYGFGGYDIFEATGESTNWNEPKNLLQPVNSPQNDLYYSLAADNSRAYITSNRKGSYFVAAETCCNDIYAYNTGKKIEKNADTATTKPDTVVIASAEKFINDTLKNVKQKLGVALYFHNDEPDAKTLSDTTVLDYRQTYEAYSHMRYEYETEYSKDLEGEEKLKAEQAIKTLFSEKIDRGYNNLSDFALQVLQLLQDGNKLEITIKGYCSPLNYNAYNIHLGNRRVASLRNYFYHYQNGILLPYIFNANLVLKNESFGEETASREISDSREDKRNSVYHPAAALERRVEIISVELK